MASSPTARLTIHGVTKDVALPSPSQAQSKIRWAGRAWWHSRQSPSIRKDYGLVWNKPLEGGGMLVGRRHVKIDINVESSKIIALADFEGSRDEASFAWIVFSRLYGDSPGRYSPKKSPTKEWVRTVQAVALYAPGQRPFPPRGNP